MAKSGDKVKVEYTGKLADGTVFDSNVGKNSPLEFAIGDGSMIAGFDKAVVGMKVGQTKTVVIPAAEAYGAHRDDLVIQVDKSQLPPNTSVKIGDQLSNGSTVFTVTAIGDTTVTLDANNELAGKDLTFTIKLLEIVK